VRLRVGGCTPACARDGLTGCRCRDRREQLGHLADLSRRFDRCPCAPGMAGMCGSVIIRKLLASRRYLRQYGVPEVRESTLETPELELIFERI
jgi:hypothetical protein